MPIINDLDIGERLNLNRKMVSVLTQVHLKEIILQLRYEITSSIRNNTYFNINKLQIETLMQLN